MRALVVPECGRWRTGRLKSHISEVLALDDWKSTFARFKRREVTGEIVLVP